MSTHRKVEDVQRNTQPAIDPHLRADALLVLLNRRADDFVNTTAFRIVRINRRNNIRQQQSHARVVRAQARVAAKNISEVIDERLHQRGRSIQNIQQRARCR